MLDVVGMNKLRQLGKILGLGAALMSAGAKDIPAQAREVAAFTEKEGRSAKRMSPPTEKQLEERMQKMREPGERIERYLNHLKVHFQNLERVRDERDRITMRWYALTEQIPIGRSEFHRAKSILGRLTFAIKILDPELERKGVTHEEVYGKSSLIINEANSDFRSFFSMSKDIQDAAYADIIK